MKKIIMIKYGELTTKKDNRNFFIKTLQKNIEEKLIDIKHITTYDYFRMFIECEEKDINKVVEILRNIFGIYEIVICFKLEDKSIDSIFNSALEIMKEIPFKTFKIETNRSDKSYDIPSMEVSRKVGGYILKNISNIKVDVNDPEVLLNIEIRQEAVYIYTKGEKGALGYPVGTLGKALLMLSGGIDSPVAAYLSMKKGIKLDYIYFESIPHTSIEARNKVIKLANILKKYGSKSNLYVINFTKIQETIYQVGNEEYIITVMRRMMYRIAERLAKKINCNAIINGESVGQVASQTLTSMKVINDVTNYPILRPLCSFDKSEIIEISKKIDTYETSIIPYEDCCTVFVPKHPVINPDIKEVLDIENKFDYESFIKEAIDNALIIKIEEEKEDNRYL